MFKNEWTAKWSFLYNGTMSMHYWCSICRQENTCSNQDITDVIRHIKSQGHQEKHEVLQSASDIAWFSVSVATSVGGMSTQEAKVHYQYNLGGWGVGLKTVLDRQHWKEKKRNVT